MISDSSIRSVCTGSGTIRGAATREPTANSPNGTQPSKVMNGWFAVASTSRPEANRTLKTSLCPL